MFIQKDFIYRWGVFPLWLLLTASVFVRPPIPIDETRYLSVAWEMWLRGDFWVPYLNGQTYSHKPPLLFWLFQGGWGLFGVNEWWPRLVGPLCALTNLLLTRKLAEKLWPAEPVVARLAPWILIATLLWTLFASSAMFDILLTGMVLLGMNGLCDLAWGNARKGGILLALSIGLGLLAKGPVVFLHLAPTAVLWCYWSLGQNKVIRPSSMLYPALAGVGIALAWAIPAALFGGEQYAKEILWYQTADRTVASQIHARPFYWYSLFLPLILFPWVFWPRVWKGVRLSHFSGDGGMRFCLVWLLSTFLIFSILPSKQIHYLIPMLPAFALLTARVLVKARHPCGLPAELLPPAVFGLIGVFLLFLPHVPGLSKLHWVQTVQAGWGLSVIGIGGLLVLTGVIKRKLSVAVVSTAVVLAIFAGFVFFFRYAGLAYNLEPAAARVKNMIEQGIPCAFVGDYQGQLQFLGRMTESLPALSGDRLLTWVRQHPDGYLISLEIEQPLDAVFLQAHREYWLVIRPAWQLRKLKAIQMT